MKYDSKRSFASKLIGCEDVMFTCRKFSHGLRSKVRAKLAPALEKIREKTDLISEVMDTSGLNDHAQEAGGIVELNDQGEPKQAEGNRFSPDQLRCIERMGDINREIDVITANEVDFVYLDAGLIEITGLEIEGHSGKVTAKVLYEDGPEDLCKEVIRRIKELAGILPEERENLESPTTSGAVVDGQTSDTIAPDASNNNGIQLVTAASTSQNE